MSAGGKHVQFLIAKIPNVQLPFCRRLHAVHGSYIAEPTPARHKHLHSRAHGFSHGLDADADAAAVMLRCCAHSQHPRTDE